MPAAEGGLDDAPTAGGAWSPLGPAPLANGSVQGFLNAPVSGRATAVAVGTANFYDPRAAEKVRDGIGSYLEERGFGDLEQIRGRVKVEG